MTKFEKTRWSRDGDELRLGVEITKVDKARRMVAGWATVDNVDTEGDQITAEASLDAFNRSRRNLREMHKKDSAVGRVVSYKPDTFRAPDGKTYNGIFVKVRVSEGAEDTWKKVLDGTLNGFSIGGSVVEYEDTIDKSSGQNVRVIKKYNLTELSLVDNPGNEYSDITNVFKFKKSADGSVTTLTGMVEEQKILNVFYCENDEIAKEAPSDAYDCPVCESKMDNIGFVEDGNDRVEKVNALLSLRKSEGGVTITKNTESNEEAVETGHESGDSTEVKTPAKGSAEPVEEVEETPVDETVEEVHDEAEQVEKMVSNVKEEVEGLLKSQEEKSSEQFAALTKALSEVTELVTAKMAEFNEKIEAVNRDLVTTKARQDQTDEKVKKFNQGGALRKSADVETTPAEPVQNTQTVWGGAFSDPRTGAFSVDNL